MRGTYVAYILVKIKDGRQFVCAINRKKNDQPPKEQFLFMEDHPATPKVIWN